MNKCVYRHLRNDTDTVFYIGQGTTHRASSRHGRNSHWNRIVNKAGFTTEIICSELSDDDANGLEILLIKLRGVDTLANHELGGKNSYCSEETKKRMSKAQKGRFISEDHKKHLRIACGIKCTDTSTGIVYNNVKAACIALEFNYNTVMTWMRRGSKPTKKSFSTLLKIQ